MNEPLVTIITPAYNSGDKLRGTVASSSSQDVPLEHLVVDGASTDGSAETAFALMREFSHLRVISEPDRGVYDAMNKAVQLARGRYLLFLGAGDSVLAGQLTAICKSLPAHDHAMVYGDVLCNGKRYDGRFSALKLCGLNICHQSILYGREVFSMLGPYNTRYRALADWDFNLRCFGDRRVQVRYVPVTVAVYEDGGLSSGGDKEFYQDHLTLIRRHLGIRLQILHWLRVYKSRTASVFKLKNFRHRFLGKLRALRRRNVPLPLPKGRKSS